MNRQIIARKGFTLVEILVAITVIAILGGMLVAGLFPALRAAREMATRNDVMQIEREIEVFQSKFGFYPPSFVQFQNLDFSTGRNSPRVALMRRYLNRIAPNNQETPDRIAAWFRARGNFINPNEGHDIVFWLSGLFKNKQYPLTKGVVIANENDTSNINFPTFSTSEYGGDNRELFFDFDFDRLVIVLVNPAQPLTPQNAAVAGYSQTDSTIAPMLYIDSASYAIEVDDPASTTLQPSNWHASQSNRRRNIGYWRRNLVPGATSNLPLPDRSEPEFVQLQEGTVTFENPKTFQLFFSGADGLCGQIPMPPALPLTVCATGFNVRSVENTDSDNIANFANGRMDSFANSLID